MMSPRKTIERRGGISDVWDGDLVGGAMVARAKIGVRDGYAFDIDAAGVLPNVSVLWMDIMGRKVLCGCSPLLYTFALRSINTCWV